MNAYQKRAYQELREAAYKVERACDKVSRGMSDDYRGFCDIVETEEKGHRRFTSSRYTFPVGLAVVYFVVRCFDDAIADTRDAISYRDLDGLRADYLRARIIVSRNRELFAPLAAELKALAARYDYTELVAGKPEGIAPLLKAKVS